VTALPPPRPRNPLERTRLPTLPPKARSRRAHLHTLAAAEGRFQLQRCAGCGAFAYPAREICPVCLSGDLPLADAPRGGVLLTETTIRVPADLYFRERAPWRVGIVRLDCGPTVISHLHAELREGQTVHMSFRLDKSGNAVAFAAPADGSGSTADPQWRELTADPQYRRVLVTNGRSAVGQEIAAALVAAGAGIVHVGIAEAWKPFAGEERLRAMAGVRIVPLDIGSESSVAELAADIAGKTDILVNTADHVRPGGLLGGRGTSSVRDEIELGYRGFIHLAQAFGPAMLARGADGIDSAAAWVNIFSVYALANWPAYGTYSASQAASLSLSHCLRAELRPGGVRVINLFTGPVDSEWYQTVPPPKLAPRAIAAAVVSSLRAGTEDVFVGDVAQDVRKRLAANPKALERELGA
jgi:NAD(P)-dependent dehydrogenase (short-subunit alcohol dehydrogenase family)/uncharacterized OB-fold protein